MTFIRLYWPFISIGLITIAATVLFGLWQHEKAHSAALEARNAEQVSEYQKAYSTAVATAYAEKTAKEKEYEKARSDGDASYAALSDQYRAALLRYQIAQAQAHPGNAGSDHLPVSPKGARIHEETAEGSGVLISADDAMKTADLAAYAQSCFVFGQGLDAAGR